VLFLINIFINERSVLSNHFRQRLETFKLISVGTKGSTIKVIHYLPREVENV
jgi:hypothetical protein